jgi:FkbH-like protein
MYQANMQRKRQQENFGDYREYLLSLDMKAQIKPFEPIYMARIAQLTNKSNQFNLTTRRYTQSEIEQFAANEGYITLYGKLEDKFGDNGVVSVVIGRREDRVLHIELWLMSCRVLKRDMEFAMMDSVVDACRKRGIGMIRGYYYPTAKNAMVRNFYELQGFTKLEEDEAGSSTWQFVIPDAYDRKNTVIAVNGKTV